MSSHENQRYEKLQASDRTDFGTTISNIAAKGRREQAHQEQISHEAVVRKLLTETRRAFSYASDSDVEDLLTALHWTLREADEVGALISPTDDRLDTDTKVTFRDHIRLRDRDLTPPEPSDEFVVLARVADALGYISSITDTTRYAPLRFETIDEPGATSTTEEPTPIGRIRVPHDSATDLDERTVEIPHQSCDHIGAVALPRRGKDSTLVTAGMNLHREHGYKYISIMDDGRMETPMIAIPNDENVIRQNLEWFGQEPRAMAADVYVPAMGGVPDLLPGNFKTFTIGIDALTPHLILRLAGVTKSDETVESRIKRALDETLDNSGSVSELVNRLQVYSREMEATIEWTEYEDAGGGEMSAEEYTATYQMDAEDALETAAQRLGQLAAEGLIASPSASTNLDMKELIAEEERAAVLCCNFLDDGLEPLKYIIMDLWLRLIYKTRDEYPRLPRVCVEIRELKNIAPSKLADVRYKGDIKTLRQTIFFLTTQGGSRRILLLGSTQKWNDVYKPVRSNIAIKVLLQLGDDEIDTLDETHHFSYEQQEQLASFDIGQGMVIAEGEQNWPLDLRGAPCGLGLGDRHWRDRYGIAWGARVREHERDKWRRSDGDLPAYWVDVATLDIYPVDDAGDKPEIGTWFLIAEDLDGAECPSAAAYDGDADQFSEASTEEQRRWVDHVLEKRREYPIPNDLLLRPSDHKGRQRSMVLDVNDSEVSIDLRDLAQGFSVPEALHEWLEFPESKFEKHRETVEKMAELERWSTQDDLADQLSFSISTMRNYWNTSLDPLYEEDGKKYVLSPVGKKAASVNWDELSEQLEEVR